LAAFAIPARVKIPAPDFVQQVHHSIQKFQKLKDGKGELLSDDQFHALESIKHISADALSPLQKLEHAMDPLVAFVIMPIFAFSNAGVVISKDFFHLLLQPVTLGIGLGMLMGKIIGVVGFSWLAIRTGKVSMPTGMHMRHLLGAGILASIGFTMSLFITGLAFTSDVFILQAKTGILVISVFSGLLGYWILKGPAAK
jgi:NhaA family Na+:H+ antiporter